MGNKPEERLKRYRARQGVPAWGRDYQPAIRATPQEAPRISRPTAMWSAKLDREVHLLSQPEVKAAYLALFHPALFDLHEQRVLSPVPTSHPLQGSPAGMGLRFPQLVGTIAIAEDLGAIKRHPKVFIDFGNGESSWVPLPYIGDLLLFLRDEEGPYCINWNIKLKEMDFHRSGPRPLGKVRRRDPDPNAELRHSIEEKHYESGHIRTVRVTSPQLDESLIANLRDLFGWHGRKHQASETQQQDAMEMLRAGIGADLPAYELVRSVAMATQLSEYDTMVMLYQGVWRRELRVDLFSPFLMTKRLVAEQEDPLLRYAAWFRR